ncbi:hypothetical protein K227x_58790 [Rubripirellula lacrimiformis]|uniref:Uncharacterized protein n=1 Tax=Rubripirellula lacrimiformis TaxID=1930273 RepID=A0A517NJZ8_9BACT|nr:hypothetical protein [Rubripirellula lacrimiformis]QDT07452.1 hypothetical protein K227x_58790 [Rubripirellula lacrimiformis]
MTQTNANKPADTIRFGQLKATIWSNPGKDGKPPRYSAVYVRSYTDDNGDWHDTTSLGEIDNLKLGHLIPKVTDRIEELKADDRNAAKAQADAA